MDAGVTTAVRTTILGGLIAVAVSAPAASAQALIADSFGSGANGWSFYNDGTNFRWDASAGSPGGCIRADDDGGGTYWGFLAGPAYLGDRSCLYGGALTWQFKTNLASSSAGSTQPDVSIIGAGLTLVLDLPLPVANTWNNRAVTLRETAGWRKTSYGGAVPTSAEFQSVLSNITAIRIRGEFSTSASDSGSLDNVAMGLFLLASPISASVCVGTPSEFAAPITVGAESGPFVYLWHKDGNPIDTIANPSAATDTLTIATAQPEDVGTYYCVVSHACGNVSSDPAILTVCACLECPADFNQDGGIDGSDVDAFFSRWENGHCDADVNADGGVDGADVDSFFAAWEAGGCG